MTFFIPTTRESYPDPFLSYIFDSILEYKNGGDDKAFVAKYKFFKYFNNIFYLGVRDSDKYIFDELERNVYIEFTTNTHMAMSVDNSEKKPRSQLVETGIGLGIFGVIAAVIYGAVNALF